MYIYKYVLTVTSDTEFTLKNLHICSPSDLKHKQLCNIEHDSLKTVRRLGEVLYSIVNTMFINGMVTRYFQHTNVEKRYVQTF